MSGGEMGRPSSETLSDPGEDLEKKKDSSSNKKVLYTC
jgi:hypothetical protein